MPPGASGVCRDPLRLPVLRDGSPSAPPAPGPSLPCSQLSLRLPPHLCFDLGTDPEVQGMEPTAHHLVMSKFQLSQEALSSGRLP